MLSKMFLWWEAHLENKNRKIYFFYHRYISRSARPISASTKLIMKSWLTISPSLPLYFFFIKIFSTEAAPNYLFHSCPNTTLFTPNSTYQNNIDTLLSSLSSAATNSTNGFANATAGLNLPTGPTVSSYAVATLIMQHAATAWPLENGNPPKVPQPASLRYLVWRVHVAVLEPVHLLGHGAIAKFPFVQHRERHWRNPVHGSPRKNPERRLHEGFSWWFGEKGRSGGGQLHELAVAVRIRAVHAGLDTIRLWQVPPVWDR